ncbi:MAG: hypothetical protein CME25_08795 [Gemmatimonadetes bacterium]|nr:hypothetical protein [Gemmatimonadota bacterium]
MWLGNACGENTMKYGSEMAPSFFASNFSFGMQDRHFIVKQEDKAISQTFLGSTSEFFEQFHHGCQRLIHVFKQNLRIHIITCILFYQRLILCICQYLLTKYCKTSR